MTGRRHREGLAVLVALLLPFLPTAAPALTFSSAVERFEADGNGYGSVGGAFDLVDEFDDDDIEPNWEILLGTAVESGGKLTLRDPGVVAPLVGLPQEISTVESTVELANGGGDFTITSYWDPTPLALNRQFFFQLYGVSPVIEASGFTVNNFDAETAADVGVPAGYSIGVERIFPFGNPEPPVAHYVSIDPLSITGQIVLRMTFDDTTDLATYSFSLDGGLTFQSPFPSLQVFKLSPDAEILLGAAAVPSSAPPPGCEVVIDPARVRFQKLSSPDGEQNVRMRGNLRLGPGVPPVFDPLTQGASFVASSTIGKTALFQIPPGALGIGGCGPGDGWKVRGRTHTYTNKSGALPPTCDSFSANGLRKAQLRDDRVQHGWIRFAVVAKQTALQPVPGIPAFVAVQIGGQDMEGNPITCGSRLLTCINNVNTQNCR